MTPPPAESHGSIPDGRGVLALVIVLAFAGNMVARGVSETFGVFLLPVEAALGATRSDMTLTYSIYMLVHGLAGPVAGSIFDRLGARAMYGTGLALLGGAYLLAAEATALWHYYLSVGVMVGLGVACLGMVAASALLSRWFSARLAPVMGVAYAAMGVGVLISLPLVQWLLDTNDWRAVYRMMGWFVLALLVPAMALPMGRMTRGAAAWRKARAAPSDGSPRWTLRTAVRTSAFWGLFNVFFFTALAAYAVLPQAVAYLVERGFDPLTAASAVGLTGMLSVVGMLNVGWLSDRYGRRRVVAITYLMTGTGILCLLAVSLWPSLVLVYGFVFLFGLNQGARGPIVSTLTAVLFPGAGIGGIYGAVTLGLGTGAALGSWASGALHDWTGGYAASFLMGVAAAVCGALQFWLVKALADDRRAKGPPPAVQTGLGSGEAP